MLGKPGGFAAEQNDVVLAEDEIRQAIAAMGGERHKPPAGGAAPGGEGRPVGVLDHGGARQVIQPGAFQVAVGEHEAARMDDVDRDAEAGAKPQDRAGVLRDVRLEKGAVDH